jgi:hypothetical protein
MQQTTTSKSFKMYSHYSGIEISQKPQGRNIQINQRNKKF